MNNDTNKYDDIISLPRPVSKKHPPMSSKARAAQFAAFAALTGYHEGIGEASRYTYEKREFDESFAEALNNKIMQLKALPGGTKTEIIYFVPDGKKDGGEYAAVQGTVLKFDDIGRKLVLSGSIYVPYDDIVDIIFEIPEY